MGKSQGNSIRLSVEPEEIRQAVHRMYTDSNYLRASDPGTVEGNVVFPYPDAFHADESAVADMKVQYRRGGLGDMAVKRRLERVLQELLGLIRTRRAGWGCLYPVMSLQWVIPGHFCGKAMKIMGYLAVEHSGNQI